MKLYNKFYEQWWMKYIVFPLTVGALLYILLGPGVSIDNSNSVSSPILFDSPNSTVNYLEGKDSLLREYGYIASLNSAGSPFHAGRGLSNKGELMYGTYVEKNGEAFFKCDEKSINRYHEIMRNEPKFPFSYFALAICRKNINKPDWIDYANKAVQIFQITTQINGCNSEHNQALNILTQKINSNL